MGRCAGVKILWMCFFIGFVRKRSITASIGNALLRPSYTFLVCIKLHRLLGCHFKILSLGIERYTGFYIAAHWTIPEYAVIRTTSPNAMRYQAKTVKS